MIIKNFTPHPVVLCDKDGKPIHSFQSEGIARIKMNELVKETLDIPTSSGIIKVDFIVREAVEGEVPEQVEGELKIVSSIVQSYLGRGDLIVPNSFVRDQSGNIIGCSNFALYQK